MTFLESKQIKPTANNSIRSTTSPINLCKEDTGIALEDGTTKLFLNADSGMDDISEELKVFLDYVAGKKSDDSFIAKLKQALNEAKKQKMEGAGHPVDVRLARTGTKWRTNI